jgi:hypothetical protein
MQRPTLLPRELLRPLNLRSAGSARELLNSEFHTQGATLKLQLVRCPHTGLAPEGSPY